MGVIKGLAFMLHIALIPMDMSICVCFINDIIYADDPHSIIVEADADIVVACSPL